MCTVTIVPLSRPDAFERGFRLVANRDELRIRPAALPPVIRVFGTRTAILPIDPVSDGTWIAVNEAGLAMTLLNVNPASRADFIAPMEKPLWSRGRIIPGLLKLGSLEETAAAIQAISVKDFAPFRLIVADGHRAMEFLSDGDQIRTGITTTMQRPLFFTSSGLGDHLVDAPRRALFNETFSDNVPGDKWLTLQDAFHSHSWPDQLHLSVCMQRSEAWTVSMSVIEVTSEQVQLAYRPGLPDRPSATFTERLPRLGNSNSAHLLKERP